MTAAEQPEQPSRFRRDRPLTAAEVEELIMETLDLMEEAAEDYAEAAYDARVAEANYRTAYAKAYLTATVKTHDDRLQTATRQCQAQLVTRRQAEAREAAAAEWCRVRREQMQALRTVAANARAAEQGR